MKPRSVAEFGKRQVPREMARPRVPFAQYMHVFEPFESSFQPSEPSAGFDVFVDRAARLLGASHAKSEPRFRLPPSLSFAQARGLIKSIVTVRDAADADDEEALVYAGAVDAVLKTEAETLRSRNILRNVAGLKPIGLSFVARKDGFDWTSRVFLHRGDVTHLADSSGDGPSLAIVNAANSAMLGCFRPDHPCIDNAIHNAAGPRLKDACAAYMRTVRSGEPEPVGTAVLTPGFSLSHRGISHVIHTVGPQIPRGRAPSQKDRDLLASCYSSVLDAALEVGIRNVALCSISTGVFGYPIEEASNIAARTVKEWLETHASQLEASQSIQRVIFDVFSERDESVVGHFLKLAAAGDLPSLPLPGPDQTEDSDEELDIGRTMVAACDGATSCRNSTLRPTNGQRVLTFTA